MIQICCWCGRIVSWRNVPKAYLRGGKKKSPHTADDTHERFVTALLYRTRRHGPRLVKLRIVRGSYYKIVAPPPATAADPQFRRFGSAAASILLRYTRAVARLRFRSSLRNFFDALQNINFLTCTSSRSETSSTGITTKILAVTLSHHHISYNHPNERLIHNFRYISRLTRF